MSSLRRGDEHLHYSDGSHRWTAPPNVEQGLWEAGLRAHQEQHLETMGGPGEQMPESRNVRSLDAHRQRRGG